MILVGAWAVFLLVVRGSCFSILWAVLVILRTLGRIFGQYFTLWAVFLDDIVHFDQ